MNMARLNQCASERRSMTLRDRFAAARTGRLLGVAMSVVLLGMQHSAHAGSLEQAKRIHDRLTGTPPSDSLLTQMKAKIDANDAKGAAMLAMDATSVESKGFYNVVLKNWVTPWTNRDRTMFAPLNDYTATVIGMVRDDVPFNTVLSADLTYTGNASGAPAFNPANNNHYTYLEDNDIDLRTALTPQSQSSLMGIPAAATAGVLTSRAASEAFFIDGTNRAMFRFTMINHLCNDMEQVEDTTRPPDRIRQDVSRSPGGDSRNFLNSCIGCHSGMDPLTQAFAYYNYSYSSVDAKDAGQLVYTAGAVQSKYVINSDNFKPGYVTPDDHWDNYWRAGPNRALGFSGSLSGSGTGAKTMGQELANSDAFAQCQVKKVFKAVCLRDPGNSTDRSEVTTIASNFKSNGYKLKDVFAETAAYCMGD
jgi:hypothetical protein